MPKKKRKYETHKDLELFTKKYICKVDSFLKSNPETKVIFLNADFGWGKTEFIKNNLKIEDNCIFSPWLNKSDNYIEEIYYNVTKTNKGLFNSTLLLFSAVITLLTILSGSIISIIIKLCDNNLFELLISIVIIIVIIIFVIAFFIYAKPIPIINFLKKDSGKYYENSIIKKLLDKVDKTLVIEDIDRIDDIEEMLIAVNKISKYLVDKKIDKYILITGDYIRMISRINQPDLYNSKNSDYALFENKGLFVTEKVISLRIDFSSLNDRINNLLQEYNLSAKLSKIEYDEIISFVKNRFLSIRFFIRFIERNKKELSKGNSIYHLLLKYYQEEKYFNVEKSILDNSIYNVSKFPNCLNDVEMLLQKKEVIIENKKYSTIENRSAVKGNYDIIINTFYSLFFSKQKHSLRIFLTFYKNEKYPALNSDIPLGNNASNITVNIGKTLVPRNLKENINNFLLGRSDKENGLIEHVIINKRCYFDAKSTDYNYNFENYIKEYVEKDKIEIVENDDFIYGYIACFFRDNKAEIKKNYPMISKLILSLVQKSNNCLNKEKN